MPKKKNTAVKKIPTEKTWRLALNPLVAKIPTRQQKIEHQMGEGNLIDGDTGEIHDSSLFIRMSEMTIDTEAWVKFFWDNPMDEFEARSISPSGQRVFWIAMSAYKKTRFSGADWVDTFVLEWNNEAGTLNGYKISRASWYKGKRECIEGMLFAKRTGAEYYMNPAVSFKGDRIAYAKHCLKVREDLNFPYGKAHEAILSHEGYPLQDDHQDKPD